MKKEITLEWNYKPSNKSSVYNQTGFDWNQTIVTKFNQLHAHHRPFDKYPIKIVTPIKFEKILKSLYYYNDETKLVADKYLIEYIELDVDYLLFHDKSKIIIKNFE